MNISHFFGNPIPGVQPQNADTVPVSDNHRVVMGRPLPQKVNQHPVKYFNKTIRFGFVSAAINPNKVG